MDTKQTLAMIARFAKDMRRAWIFSIRMASDDFRRAEEAADRFAGLAMSQEIEAGYAETRHLTGGFFDPLRASNRLNVGKVSLMSRFLADVREGAVEGMIGLNGRQRSELSAYSRMLRGSLLDGLNSGVALFAQLIRPLGGKSPGVHAEFLVMLVDTDGTLILPGVFMPSAERFNQATRIDRWVLNHTIQFLSGLSDLSALNTISLNLSDRSLGDRAFHRYAVAVLDAAGAAICSRLSLETTETAAVANIADASFFIEQVHALGVRVALDDFVAGAASFD